MFGDYIFHRLSLLKRTDDRMIKALTHIKLNTAENEIWMLKENPKAKLMLYIGLAGQAGQRRRGVGIKVFWKRPFLLILIFTFLFVEFCFQNDNYGSISASTSPKTYVPWPRVPSGTRDLSEDRHQTLPRLGRAAVKDTCMLHCA